MLQSGYVAGGNRTNMTHTVHRMTHIYHISTPQIQYSSADRLFSICCPAREQRCTDVRIGENSATVYMKIKKLNINSIIIENYIGEFMRKWKWSEITIVTAVTDTESSISCIFDTDRTVTLRATTVFHTKLFRQIPMMEFLLLLLYI